MSAKHKRDVELLLSYMPDNGFLQGLSNRLRTGMSLTPKQVSALEGIKVRMSSKQAKIKRDKARVSEALKVYSENPFLQSLLEHLSDGKSLSAKQDEALRAIEVRAARRLANMERRSAGVKREMLGILRGLSRVSDLSPEESEFVGRMVSLVEGDLKISVRQKSYIRGLCSRHLDSARGRSSADKFGAKVKKHFGGRGKKASVSRAWDYDKGEWAYRVDGGNIKYASEEVLDYKVEWGDPPKPNAWRAILKGRMSDGRIEVTSPLIVGRIVFNIFPHEIDVSYRRKGYSTVDLGTIRRHDDMDSIFSHATYTKYIKPAIMSGVLELGSQGKKIASGEGFEG